MARSRRKRFSPAPGGGLEAAVSGAVVEVQELRVVLCRGGGDLRVARSRRRRTGSGRRGLEAAVSRAGRAMVAGAGVVLCRAGVARSRRRRSGWGRRAGSSGEVWGLAGGAGRRGVLCRGRVWQGMCDERGSLGGGVLLWGEGADSNAAVGWGNLLHDTS